MGGGNQMTDYKALCDRSKHDLADRKAHKQAEVDNYVFTRQRATARRKRNRIGYKYVVAGQV